jgi:hypothetical protein
MSENFKNPEPTKIETVKDTAEEIRNHSIQKFKIYAEGRGAQFNTARKKAEEIALSPAIYIRELLDLMLNPEERERFHDFDEAVDLLKKDFTHKV